MVPLRDSLMRKRSSPAGPLSRKRAPSASPTKPQPQSYSRADTFILRVGRAGYEIEYSPAWSIEHAAARFLTTYSLGCEWRTRVEGMLREQVVPEVERALEWSRRSQSSKSKENFRAFLGRHSGRRAANGVLQDKPASRSESSWPTSLES